MCQVFALIVGDKKTNKKNHEILGDSKVDMCDLNSTYRYKIHNIVHSCLQPMVCIVLDMLIFQKRDNLIVYLNMLLEHL